METVGINSSKSYDVIIGSGLLPDAGKYITEILSCKTAVIVSDDNVFSLYGETLKDSLAQAGLGILTFVFPHGEQNKTLSTYGDLLNAMCSGHISRSDTVIALGGGVVGDLAGFAAATYQRGIALVQMPTTLLAAVDSSVGGKTGVDLESGKNQVGSFYQPSMVLCDTDTLKTLPETEYRNGCAEIIKYAMIGSYDLFRELSKTPVCRQYESVISKCVSMKRDYIEQDEHDLGCRMMLNFGHTVGHAIETCSHYTIPHGEAVAIGMAMITRAACTLGICEISVLDALLQLIDKYALPSESPFESDILAAAALTDKKRKGDKLTIVIPEDIGKCVLKEIPKDELYEWIKAGGSK